MLTKNTNSIFDHTIRTSAAPQNFLEPIESKVGQVVGQNLMTHPQQSSFDNQKASFMSSQRSDYNHHPTTISQNNLLYQTGGSNSGAAG